MLGLDPYYHGRQPRTTTLALYGSRGWQPRPVLTSVVQDYHVDYRVCVQVDEWAETRRILRGMGVVHQFEHGLGSRHLPSFERVGIFTPRVVAANQLGLDTGVIRTLVTYLAFCLLTIKLGQSRSVF